MGFFDKFKPAPELYIHNLDQELIIKSDIIWYNGLSLNDCIKIEKQDKAMDFSFFFHFTTKEGLDVDSARKKTRLIRPFYYWKMGQIEIDKKHYNINDIDSLIPFALKNRVNRAIEGGVINKEMIEDHSSFNALIRELIRSGNL